MSKSSDHEPNETDPHKPPPLASDAPSFSGAGFVASARFWRRSGIRERWPSSGHALRTLAKQTGIAVATALLSGCVCKDVPVEQRLADCTNSTLRMQMTVQEFPPYQFVLGTPPTAIGQMTFRGEVIVSQSTGTVARVRISSEDVTPCNWLVEGLSGYILTWGRTNDAERLESFLTRGQTYDLEVHFSELPPQESSLWLSSMGRSGL